MLVPPPERLRQEVLDRLTVSIEAGRDSGEPLKLTLGLPDEMVEKIIELASGGKEGEPPARAVAMATLAVIAAAYKVPNDSYFRYGWRLRHPEGVAENPSWRYRRR